MQTGNIEKRLDILEMRARARVKPSMLPLLSPETLELIGAEFIKRRKAGNFSPDLEDIGGVVLARMEEGNESKD